jgi:hypothetical protein
MYAAILSGSSTEMQILDNWLEIVGHYCNLELTQQTDRLIALSGLVSRVATRLGSVYLAGLWSQDLPRSLCWQLNILNTTRSAASKTASWSWASVCNQKDRDSHSSLAYDVVLHLAFVVDERLAVVGYKYLPKTTDLSGDCIMASIDMQGALITGICSIPLEPDGDSFCVRLSFKDDSARFSEDIMDGNWKPVETTHGDELYCLLLGRSQPSRKDGEKAEKRRFFSLVLKKLDHEKKVYQRVGFQHMQVDWWLEAPVVHLTVI